MCLWTHFVVYKTMNNENAVNNWMSIMLNSGIIDVISFLMPIHSKVHSAVCDNNYY